MSQSKINEKELEKKIDAYLHCVGVKLFDLRKARGESLKTVAKATHMCPGIISSSEKGLYRDLCVSRVAILCKYYNVQLVDVLVCD